MNIDIKEILPGFLLKDHNGYAIAKATEIAMDMLAFCAEEALKLVDLDGIQAGRYTTDEIPEWRMDEIAWSYNTMYDPDAPASVKLEMIRNAMRFFQRNGTQSNVDMILSIINSTLPVPVYSTVSGNNINLAMDTEDTDLVQETLAKVKSYLLNAIPLKASIRATALEADFTRMWANRNDLTYIDLSPWQNKQITGIDQAFLNCRNLESINLATLDTQLLTSMNGTFDGCSKLTNIDLSNWNLHNVTSARRVFAGVQDLTLNISTLDLASITDLTGAFGELPGESTKNLIVRAYGTKNINADINLSNCPDIDFDYSFMSNQVFANVTPGSRKISLHHKAFFVGIIARGHHVHINNGWNIETNLALALGRYSHASVSGISLGYLRAGSIKTTSDYLRGAFNGETKYVSVKDVSCFDLSNIVDASIMCYGNEELTTFDFSGTDLRNVTKANDAFGGCKNLLNVTLPTGSMAPARKLNDISHMFYACSSLKKVDLAGWSFDPYASSVKLNDMFTGCKSLTEIHINTIMFKNSGTASGTIFRDCESLVTLELLHGGYFGYGVERIYMEKCPLSGASMLSVMNALEDTSTYGWSHRIDVSQTAWNNASATTKAGFATKGWDVYVNNVKVN